jgi:hypothetical protein
MKDHKRRVMIIVWWWHYGGLEGTSDEWPVGPDRSGDCIIRIDQRYSENALSIISQKTLEYLPDSEVFVFLHRSHGYSGRAIKALLEIINKNANNLAPVRCFLFGEGNGALYISTNPRGLLGTKGTFSAQRINGTTQWIDAREDLESMTIKRDHFNNVWNTYAKAFKAKVFELQEDIFLALSPFLTQQTSPANELYQHLRRREHQLLFLRLLSFTGKLRKGSSQEKLLLEQENLQGRAFDFNDFSTNLGTVYESETFDIYTNLVENINQKLFTGVNHYDLSKLRDGFASLLQSMPEEMYN